MEEHGSDVKHVFRHLPLAQHEYAWLAAEAAEAAGEQGKFWEMAERTLASNSNLSPEFFSRTALELGLNMARFNAALLEQRHLSKIQADVDEANRLGISATPTFVINGRQYRGAPTYEQLDAAVREALQAQ